MRFALAVVVACIAACSSKSSTAPATPYAPPPLVAARPYGFKEPPTYDPTKPTPLVVVLHGYSASGLVQQAYFGFPLLSSTKQFLLAYPDGTLDSKANHFWNATDGCCDFDRTGVDDVAYINQVIDDVVAQYNVDPKRIYLVGHSNGAFLSHRLGCELASRVAAIITLAGMQWLDPSKCNPAAPVAVLQVHGDADTVVPYGGGTLMPAGQKPLGPFPSARQTAATWAAKNGCTGALAPTGQTLDLEATIAGAETTVERYDGCRADTELWTIHGGVHIPSLSSAWPDAMWSWLEAHPKP